ncbi:MAG: DUF1440 domain-containing protein [candidate division NC10 bacterium]|nr:DUF1440 domain-containing protein [candidate division NC10 bacterium]
MSAKCECGSVCSVETGKPFRTGPDIFRGILSGFVGTVAITLMIYFVAPMMVGTQMDIAGMLGSLLGGNWWAGLGMHFLNGTIIFPLLFAFLLCSVLPGSLVLKGVTWGVILWVLAQVVVMPMMGMGLFSGSMLAAGGSLMGHLVYGVVLGGVYGLKSAPASAPRPVRA